MLFKRGIKIDSAANMIKLQERSQGGGGGSSPPFA